MILPVGVVQSIDANFDDVTGGWIFASADIYTAAYTQVLLQPVLVSAATLGELRFLASSTTLVVRRTEEVTSNVMWAGYCVLDPDPEGVNGVTAVVPAEGMTASGTSTITLGWQDPDPANVRLADGTTAPYITGVIGPTSYYDSTFPATIAATTVQTTLVPGITPMQPEAEVAGKTVTIIGAGTIKFNNLADYITWVFSLGGVTLSTFTLSGNDLKVGAINTVYVWELSVVQMPAADPSTATPVQLVGTLTVYDDYVVLPISINGLGIVDTQIANAINVTVQWDTPGASDVLVCDKFRVSLNAEGSISPISVNYDGGEFDSIYGGAIVIDGGTL